MQFSVKITDYQKNLMLNICDANILGKSISEDKLTVNISKNYYGDEIVGKDTAAKLLKNSSIINMAGKETVSLSLELGIGSENAVKTISGVPFLIIFKM
ncbi:MAG: DUF424 domain-containing protein [Nitrosopumilus sp.]|jgi:hypothetical protein|nr:DUF424 domain-containing protein [Nitrosopumilus sp.]